MHQVDLVGKECVFNGEGPGRVCSFHVKQLVLC